MNNVSEFPSRQDARPEEAGKWIAKLERGVSEEEEQELGKWLSKDSQNYQNFMELAKLWDRMDTLARLADIFPEPRGERHLVSNVTAWALAATVLIAISLTMVLTYIVPEQERVPTGAVPTKQVVYQTAIGEQSTRTLADGTVLALNTNTRVRVHYTPANRILTLERGEIHVTVAHDQSRPLSVMVADRVVQAVGTEFNLEITSDQSIELIVTKGVVMVGVLDSSVEELPTDKPLVLTPLSKLIASGQEASLNTSEKTLESIDAQPIESDEIAVKLSWREGNLIFRGEPLEEAVKEIGRYTAVQFVFLDDKAKKVRVAGLFKAGDVDGLLAALRNHFNISYEWQGDDKIVLSSE